MPAARCSPPDMAGTRSRSGTSTFSSPWRLRPRRCRRPADDVKETFDLILAGGTLLLPGGAVPADVGVRAGRTVAIGDLGAASAASRYDVKGLTVMPGVIDEQVHFREP